MSIAISLVVGLVFGIGLVISGMIDPAKVQNFLDLFGTWDPSLAFVMAGAIGVGFVGYRYILRRPAPLLGDRFAVPEDSAIEMRHIVGPAIFGIGWGLSGFCPGPAIASLSLLAEGTLVFVPAMLVGIALAKALRRGREGQRPASPASA
jgi:uncharacterized membrane protein YedE/YeeE